MKTYKLYVTRHGTTQGNLEGIYVGGGTDMPVCPQGMEELQTLKQRYTYPAVGTVFSSPMLRALQTAELLYPAAQDRIVLEELRENRFGEFEGQKAADLMKDERFRDWLNPKGSFVPKGGESGAEFARRTGVALGLMLNHMARNGIFEAACVTHGGVIMSMLGQRGMPQRPHLEWMAGNGCGFVLQATAAMLMRDNFIEVAGTLPFGLQWSNDEVLSNFALQ